jgi:hypothetical protein
MPLALEPNRQSHGELISLGANYPVTAICRIPREDESKNTFPLPCFTAFWSSLASRAWVLRLELVCLFYPFCIVYPILSFLLIHIRFFLSLFVQIMRFFTSHAALAAVLLAALSSAAPLHTEALKRQDASGKLVFAHFMVRGWF